MSKYVCGIDIGTTGVKVMIFDMDGTAISSNYSEYPCTFPQTGWVEQDGNMTWQCTCETSKKAIEKSGLDPKEIVAIGLSTQRCTVTPIDKDGNPLCDAISWQDSRSFEEVEDIKRIVGEEKFYEITGYPLGTVLSVTEIMWWKKHKPEIYENAYLFVLDQERVLHAPNGVMLSEILHSCFCSHYNKTDVEVQQELGIGRTSFYKMKKQALGYLGFYFYEIVVPQAKDKRFKPSLGVEEE